MRSPADRCWILFLALLFLPLWVLPPCPAQDAFSDPGESSASVDAIMRGGQGRPRADTYYLMALAAARKGKIPEAQKALGTGLAIEPTNPRLLNLQAALWVRAGRLVDARRQFQRVLAMFPDDLYARESLAAINKTLPPPKPRVDLFRPPAKSSDAPAAPVKQETASPARILQSEYFDQMKDKQRCFYAMAALKRAQDGFVKANPTKKDTFDPQLLIEEKMLSAAPICAGNATYTWKNDAPLCPAHGDYPTLDAEIHTVFLDFNRGMQAKLSRNFPDAQRAFEQVVVTYPRWAEAHYQLGDTLFRLGNDQGALERLKASLAIKADNLDAKMLLANCYFKMGHQEAALKLLDDVAAASSGSVYGLAARSIAKSIRAGRNYYQIFPP